jgi:hypothetical protein
MKEGNSKRAAAKADRPGINSGLKSANPLKGLNTAWQKAKFPNPFSGF